MLPEPAYPQTGHGYNTYHHQDYISPKPVPIHETVTHYSNNNSVSDEQFYAYLFQLAASGRCPACVVLGIQRLTKKSSFPNCSMERSIEYGGGWTNSLPLEDQTVPEGDLAQCGPPHPTFVQPDPSARIPALYEYQTKFIGPELAPDTTSTQGTFLVFRLDPEGGVTARYLREKREE